MLASQGVGDWIRHPLGRAPIYYRPQTPKTEPSATIKALRPTHLDPRGLRAYLGRRVPRDRTCFEGIHQLPPGFRWAPQASTPWSIPPDPAPERSLELRLLAPMRAAIAKGPTALALSGGLDSALLAALLKKAGLSLPVYTLSAQLPGYNELERTLETASALAIEPEVVIANAEDFVRALPDAIRAIEVPLYNLHPLSKTLLARRLHRDGIRSVITGDGADQVFAGSDPSDYIPLLDPLFEAQGVSLCAPFLELSVLRYAQDQALIDREKTALRTAAKALLPDSIRQAPKRSAYTPPLPLRPLLDSAPVEALFEHLRALGAEDLLPRSTGALNLALDRSFEQDAALVSTLSASYLLGLLEES